MLKKIFKGELKDGEIQHDYYFNVAKKLTDAVAKGLKGDSFKATDYRNTLKAHLDHNVFAFSAAKNFEALQLYKSKLTDDNGKVVSYGNFRNAVTEVDVEFNDSQLRAEYNSAISMAQAADKWNSLQQYEYLEYRTVGDNRVRKTHKELDTKVFRRDDPLLDEIFPPNDWGCRCTMIPAARGAKADPQQKLAEAVNSASVKPYFKRNVGKTKMIFSNAHPLMQKLPITDGAVELRAKENYNMPSAKDILRGTNLPKQPKEKTPEQALKWFEQNAKNGVIPVTTHDGITVNLGNNFMNKLISSPTNERADRTNYAHAFLDVVQNPDEVWSHYHRGKIQNTYIKYYEGKAYVAAIKDKANKMEFETFHKIDNPENKRVGVLKYRK